jgi:O-acetyl-ADP-ribose deacetylase (regulator of RNase III)
MAFPLISAGIYGWPLQDAADTAVETLRRTEANVSEARLMAFGADTLDALTAALARHP